MNSKVNHELVPGDAEQYTRDAFHVLLLALPDLSGTDGAYPATSASTRSGLPLPLTIFRGAAMTTAPVGGS